MSSGPLLPSCLNCRWRQRNFRARSDSFCRLHQTIIFGTLCPELDSEESPAVRGALQAWQLDKPGIYVWLLFFRTVENGSDEPPYYHEPAYLTDYATYVSWKGHVALAAQQQLHKQLKESRARDIA
jgi:hypothetical protein